MSEERLRRELEESFRNRAHLYRLMLEELRAALGPEQAEALLSRVVAKRGQEVAAQLFTGLGANDARKIGETFLAVSPNQGRLYPHEAQPRSDGISIRVQRCPLKDAWQDADLPPAEIATLCRIAGAFDKGLFEATGIRFAAETWTEARGGGCCHIHLTDAEI